MNAIMTGTTINLDMENPPDECPMEIVMACEFIYTSFLESKMESEKQNDINQSIQDLLKGTN
jgi:hypothetical protein